MPTSVGLVPPSCAASHSATPRRVQCLRGLRGGPTSVGEENASATQTRRPFRLEVGVSAPE